MDVPKFLCLDLVAFYVYLRFENINNINIWLNVRTLEITTLHNGAESTVGQSVLLMHLYWYIFLNMLCMWQRD